MEIYGVFPRLVILGNVPGCNWSGGPNGYFKVGPSMSLFVSVQ